MVIRHLYVGRRVTPLDVFLADARPATRARRRSPTGGGACSDLAAANIFPGDMLAKNFGVTRHGRVVFYDYDELCALDACQLPRLPPPRDDDDELQPEPWFSVATATSSPRSSRASSARPAAARALPRRARLSVRPRLVAQMQERNREAS